MSDSDLSSLSSAPSIESEDELQFSTTKKGPLDRYFQNGAGGASAASPPPKRKRPASPPHEYVLADHADIAFIVMFRSRFSAAFPKSLPHYGPQDIEKGVGDTLPDEHIERLLCALLGLVLNRKKDVERGHFQRALEEAVQLHYSQWPSAWEGRNPLHGGGSFNTMTPEQRLILLKNLIMWSLGSSDAIQAILKESYKQQRHDDDLNQPLSVQPWGRDGEKRRYWLIEGQDDTHFRLYRESNPALKHNTWRSVAGTIDELKVLADRLKEEGTQAAKRLAERITLAIPRFEASEDKRKRRDYRNARKAQFTRPEPGFSLYEGRTRGKRIRYNFSDDDEGASDAPSTRRSNRHSGISTPAEPAGPTFTASGRQVKARVGGAYGETKTSGGRTHETENTDAMAICHDSAEQPQDAPTGRTRSRGIVPKPRPTRKRKHIDGYNEVDDMDEESEASMSGEEWNGGDDDEEGDDNIVDDEDDEDADMTDSGGSADDEDELAKPSLVVSLRYPKKQESPGVGEHLEEKILKHVNGFNNSVPVQQNGVNAMALDANAEIKPQVPKDYGASSPQKMSLDGKVTLHPGPAHG